MLKVIDCYAPWCQPCKVMTPLAEEVTSDLGAELIKIDVDQDNDNRVKYNVMSIPTFIIEKDGEEVGRFVGSKSKEEFRNQVAKFL